MAAQQQSFHRGSVSRVSSLPSSIAAATFQRKSPVRSERQRRASKAQNRGKARSPRPSSARFRVDAKSHVIQGWDARFALTSWITGRRRGCCCRLILTWKQRRGRGVRSRGRESRECRDAVAAGAGLWRLRHVVARDLRVGGSLRDRQLGGPLAARSAGQGGAVARRHRGGADCRAGEGADRAMGGTSFAWARRDFDLPTGCRSHDVAAACRLRSCDRSVDQLELTDVHGAEHLGRLTYAPGDVVLGDRYYARPRDLRPVIEAGADFIVRTGWIRCACCSRTASPSICCRARRADGAGR